MRFEGKRFPLRAIIQAQARQVGSYLRGEREAYVPYKAEW
jgi:CRISPR-associated protein Cas1